MFNTIKHFLKKNFENLLFFTDFGPGHGWPRLTELRGSKFPWKVIWVWKIKISKYERKNEKLHFWHSRWGSLRRYRSPFWYNQGYSIKNFETSPGLNWLENNKKSLIQIRKKFLRPIFVFLRWWAFSLTVSIIFEKIMEYNMSEPVNLKIEVALRIKAGILKLKLR